MSETSAALVRAIANVRDHATPDFDRLASALPVGVDFASDVWNLAAWDRRADTTRSLNADFSQIKHAELRDAAKMIVLKRRVERGSDHAAALTCVRSAAALGAVLRARPIAKMTTQDAHSAARRLLRASPAYLAGLSTFVGELRRLYGVAVRYKAPNSAEARHGTKGNDAGRAKKRISDGILLSLVTLNHRAALPLDDRLFLSAIALNLACGWRVGELLTLPADCLFKDEETLYARGYASKGGKLSPKPIAPAFVPMVEAAYEIIHEITEPGRRIVREWALEDAPVWREVLKDESARVYFAQKLLHAWSVDPDHRLINPDAAWHRDRGWIDVLGEIGKHPSERQAYLALGLDWNTFMDLKKQQQEARLGRLWTRTKSISARAWMRDGRVCDKFTLFRLMGLATGQKYHTPEIENLVLVALEHQKAGDVIPPPARDEALEERYRRKPPALLRDKDGAALLRVDEALFVVPKFFIGARTEKSNDWQALTVAHVAQWLAGTPSRPSVFERYDVRDPDTGEVARFTSHQVRHWLETQFHKGGLTNAQIATIMNRNDVRGNSVYNQMSNAERRRQVKEGIHGGEIGGVVADVVRRSDVTQVEADDILAARLRQINVMPHGLCLKDLATEPCPHHMSCFSTRRDEGARHACAHLLVDRSDTEQLSAIRREHDNAAAMVEMFEDDPDLEESPQVEHFRTIMETTQELLGDDPDQQSS